MNIKEIVVTKENLKLTRPYSISYKAVDAVENCIVEIITESGLSGMGACNPSKQVVGEAVEDTLQVLTDENLEWLVGRDIREMPQLCYEVYQKFPHNPGASVALDVALHDLFSQYLKVPLVFYLGQKIRSLPTSITIGIKNVQETLEEANEYIQRGFKVLKVKLGKSVEEDLERIKKLREVHGNDIVIRVDANQGYSMLETEDFYHNTLSCDLELIEQPMKADAVEEMKQLPTEMRQIIAADESLISPQDAFRLAEKPAACGIFNIKLMKCGGIGHAQSIATIAQQAGIDLMWGCNDESIISISAALHAAFSCPNTKYIDLDGSFDLAKDVVKGGFTLKDGMMSPLDKPGLGIEKL